VNHTDLVQRALSTWFRTLRSGVALSETVVAASLRTRAGELRDGSAGTLQTLRSEVLRFLPIGGNGFKSMAQFTCLPRRLPLGHGDR